MKLLSKDFAMKNIALHFSRLSSLVLLLAAGCATGKYGAFEPKGELAIIK